jgi:hypothetical protein
MLCVAEDRRSDSHYFVAKDEVPLTIQRSEGNGIPRPGSGCEYNVVSLAICVMFLPFKTASSNLRKVE